MVRNGISMVVAGTALWLGSPALAEERAADKGIVDVAPPSCRSAMASRRSRRRASAPWQRSSSKPRRPEASAPACAGQVHPPTHRAA